MKRARRGFLAGSFTRFTDSGVLPGPGTGTSISVVCATFDLPDRVILHVICGNDVMSRDYVSIC